MLVNRDVVKIIARIGIEYVKRIPPTISLKYERAFESVVDSEVVSLVIECEWREYKECSYEEGACQDHKHDRVTNGSNE